jgi:hypothetical protein
MSNDNMTRSEAKTRWSRFGLRTLFVVFTLVSLCLGWFMYRVNQQRRVVAALQRHRAQIQFSPFSATRPWSDRLPEWLRSRLTNALRSSPDLQWVTDVTVDDRQFGDNDLDGLRNLPHLRYLSLIGTGVTDAGIERIEDLKALDALEFSGENITHNGMPFLAELANLKWLVLTDTAVTDSGIAYLGTLNKLDELHLNGTKVTGGCLHNLAAIESLRLIHLTNTSVCGERLAELAKMRSREVVEATNTPISDADVRYLEQIHNAILWIGSTKLSSNALGQLPAGWRTSNRATLGPVPATNVQ